MKASDLNRIIDLLPAPVPCRGAQGLWEVPQNEREAVLRQLPSGR